MFSLSRLDRARASLFSILSLDSLPDSFAVDSLYEEPVLLLASSLSGLSHNVVVSAGVLAVISLLIAHFPIDGLAIVIFRHTGFLDDTMIVNQARRSM